jgi:hypothetical protein
MAATPFLAGAETAAIHATLRVGQKTGEVDPAVVGRRNY